MTSLPSPLRPLPEEPLRLLTSEDPLFQADLSLSALGGAINHVAWTGGKPASKERSGSDLTKPRTPFCFRPTLASDSLKIYSKQGKRNFVFLVWGKRKEGIFGNHPIRCVDLQMNRKEWIAASSKFEMDRKYSRLVVNLKRVSVRHTVRHKPHGIVRHEFRTKARQVFNRNRKPQISKSSSRAPPSYRYHPATACITRHLSILHPSSP
jgi:hypothetical protein